MIEALSEIISLAGVSGRMDEAGRAGALKPGGPTIPAEWGVGTSVFAEDTTLRVLGMFRARGDAAVAVGVGRAGKASLSATGVSVATGCALAGFTGDAFVAAAIFNTPGAGFLSPCRVDGLGAAELVDGSGDVFSEPLACLSRAFLLVEPGAFADRGFGLAMDADGCVVVLDLRASKAGKSSSPKFLFGFDLEGRGEGCEAASLGRLDPGARARVSFFTSGLDDPVASLVLWLMG